MEKKGLRNGNGMVNGTNRGMVNGLTNGLTNGNGRSNGLVNGGNGKNNKRGVMETTKGRLGAWTVIGIVLLLIFGAFGISTNLFKSVNWSEISKYRDYDMKTVGMDSIDIKSFAFHRMGDSFYFYIKFGGDFSSARDYKNLAYILIDNDSSMATGYNTGYIGADYMIKLTGNESVSGSAYIFVGEKSDEWNWSEIESASVKYSDNVLTGYSHISIDENARIMIVAESGYSQDITPVVGIEKNALLVTQKVGSDNNIDIKLVPLLGKVNVKEISFTATRGISLSGANVSGNTLTINKAVGAETTYRVTVYPRDVKGKVEVSINSVSTGSKIPITVWGLPFRKYFGTPQNIEIDGCFEDWNKLASFNSEPKAVDNSNIDIYQYANYLKNGTFFYASVKGTMLEGNIAPEMERTMVHHGGGGVPVNIVKKPYDYARVDIETANNGPHTIEVYGYNGKITDVLYDGKKSNIATAAVGKNGNYGAIEIGLNESYKIISYRITMTDWSGASDTTGIKSPQMQVIDVRALSGWVLVGVSKVSGSQGADLDRYYLGWDDTNLYLNLTTNNTASWDVAYGFALDVDQSAGSGFTNSTNGDAWDRKISFVNADPYLPDYEVYVWWSGSDGKITSDNLCSYSGGSWNYYKFGSVGIANMSAGDGSSGLQWINITIPWSSIGGKPSTGKIATMAWVAGGSDSSAVDTVPYDSAVPTGDSWTDWDEVTSMTVEPVPEFSAIYAMPTFLILLPIILRRNKK